MRSTTDYTQHDLQTELESLGEQEVRRRLAAGAFTGRQRKLIQSWLESNAAERSRQRNRKEEAHKRAELTTARSSALATWIGSIVAGLSLLLSIAAFGVSRHAVAAAEAERINVSITPDTGTPVARVVTIEDSGRIDTFWECLVTNAGTRGGSIVNIEVDPLIDPSDTVWSYEGILAGVFDRQGRPVQLPIFLEAGGSRRVFLRLGFRVDRATRDRLLARFPDSQIPMIRRRTVEIERIAIPNSSDTSEGIMRTFNTVVFDSTLRVPEPTFLITLRTDRGTPLALFTARY